MQLSFQSAKQENSVLIRCRGRLVAGEEARALQSEVDQLTLGTKRVVLNLEQVSFLDSGGLGALVRLSVALRAGKGGLVLCHVSPFVLQVLQVTNLHRAFQICATESEAIQSVSLRSPSAEPAQAHSRARVICVDPSPDLLAFLGAVLKRSGYEVFTSSSLADARTLIKATRPRLLICGPAIVVDDLAHERIRQLDPPPQILQLPPGFSSAEPSKTGAELLERVQALLPPA